MVTVRFTPVTDATSYLLESAPSSTGPWTTVTTLDPISGAGLISYVDDAGTTSTWYRVTAQTPGGPITSDPFHTGSPDFCTLSDIRGYLGLEESFTSDDATLARLAMAASAWLKTAIGRDITSTIYDETYNGDGTQSLVLLNAPVQTVYSLTVDGVAITARTATDAGYVVQNDRLYLSGALNTGLSSRSGTYFARGFANVEVQYMAGYSSVPDDVKQAAIYMASEAYERRKRVGIMSRGIAGEATTFQMLSLDPWIQTVINNYKRYLI